MKKEENKMATTKDSLDTAQADADKKLDEMLKDTDRYMLYYRSYYLIEIKDATTLRAELLKKLTDGLKAE